MARRLDMLQTAVLSQTEAPKVVGEYTPAIVDEFTLIENQVEDVVELLAFGSLTDESLSLLFQANHQLLLLLLLLSLQLVASEL